MPYGQFAPFPLPNLLRDSSESAFPDSAVRVVTPSPALFLYPFEESRGIGKCGVLGRANGVKEWRPFLVRFLWLYLEQLKIFDEPGGKCTRWAKQDRLRARVLPQSHCKAAEGSSRALGSGGESECGVERSRKAGANEAEAQGSLAKRCARGGAAEAQGEVASRYSRTRTRARRALSKERSADIPVWGGTIGFRGAPCAKIACASRTKVGPLVQQGDTLSCFAEQK